ncbi:MAG TPA: TetR/AcrR family transcriptional regulator [Clostridia bacterium]|nr:TetR/AcrR family transcriptional regulator [Clostridia bacterium]
MARKTGNKYDNIIEAAVKIIAKNGYHNSQVSKIAKEAGVADGTIYLYFRNKEDILVSVFNNKMTKFIDHIREKIELKEEPLDKLKDLIKSHFSYLEADRNLALVTQIELRQSNPSIREAITEVIIQYYMLIEDVLKMGIEKGVLRKDLDIRLSRKMIFGALDEVVTCWVLSKKRYKLTDSVDNLFFLLLNGLV